MTRLPSSRQPLTPEQPQPDGAKRRYVLTKLGPGDYLLPSNDAKTIWRLRTYEDGPSYGLENWPRDRTLWGVWEYCRPFNPACGSLDVDDPGAWEFWEGWCETRSEAIHKALTSASA